MARSEDYIIKEIRDAQKNLINAKRRGGITGVAIWRARIAELQKEMESAE